MIDTIYIHPNLIKIGSWIPPPFLRDIRTSLLTTDTVQSEQYIDHRLLWRIDKLTIPLCFNDLFKLQWKDHYLLSQKTPVRGVFFSLFVTWYQIIRAKNRTMIFWKSMKRNNVKNPLSPYTDTENWTGWSRHSYQSPLFPYHTNGVEHLHYTQVLK
jgi:hypothetical protein